jgi:ectoine hydroxylase-related dioxygenase (phytanoyl-CoA dioxygenase family)
MQAWHVDGGHLFGRKLECPAHCLDVFIPLVDVPSELGPTEFIPGTHTLAGAAKVESVLGSQGPEAVSKSQRYNPALTAGAAILYDHRYACLGMSRF